MAADPEVPNTLTSSGRGRSVVQGDAPEALKRRYYTDDRGGAGLGFYTDATVAAPAFRDQGRQLVATRADPNAIRDMATIAQHRGWSIVSVRGAADFRREAWLAGRALGIEVQGYRPTERDIQELARRQERRHRSGDRRELQETRREDGGGRAHLRVVDAVVRARVGDADRQERIMAAARDRIAAWLERGARFEPLRMSEREGRVGPERRRER